MSEVTPKADPTRITLSRTADYKDSYANSVQVRLSVWDFHLVFGTLEQRAADEVAVENFQGIYLSPQQAKALQNILSHNLAQYEQMFGTISLSPPDPGEPRFVMPSSKGPIH